MVHALVWCRFKQRDHIRFSMLNGGFKGPRKALHACHIHRFEVDEDATYLIQQRSKKKCRGQIRKVIRRETL